MKKVTFKPQGTVVVQFTANSEVNALVHDGVVYVPLSPSFAEEAESAAPSKKSAKAAPVDDEEEEEEAPAPKKAAIEAPKKVVDAGGKKYTEEELMAIDSKELEKMCAKMGIEPDEETKNTNKKLRLLILAAQKSGGSAKEEAPTTSRKGAASANPNEAKVAAIIKSLDDGDINEAKAEAKLVELGMGKKDAKSSIAEFMSNGDLKVSDFVKTLLPLLSEEEAEEEAAEEEEEKPKARRGAPAPAAPVKKAKSKVVTEDELEVGDKVSVFWEDADEHLTGEVSKIDKKGVKVVYDIDGDDLYLDENNTEILLLS